MKTRARHVSFATLALMSLLCSPGIAQTTDSLDPAVMKEQLSSAVKKPRFTPKSAIQSRTYTRNAKGVGIEVTEYATGEREERPYVAIPILFVVGTDELLDATSRQNVEKTAAVLRELMAEDGKARFMIQGHCSAEGNVQDNLTLSEDRARKIHALLTRLLGENGARLGQMGFGSAYSTAPLDAPEAELQRDRRVLVVRQ